MSSSQVYPTMSGTIDPEQMRGDSTTGAVCTEWYAPNSYAYNDPYVTPYPTSTIEGQPWSSYVRASVPEVPLPSYSQQHQQHYLQHPPIIPTQIKDPSRPRSSPSTFGPSADSIAWPVTTTGLGIQYSSTAGQPTPVTSTFPPSVFQTFPTGDHYGSSSPPELRQPQPRRPYPPIAPNPAGLVKRRQDDDEQMERSSSKRRKRTASVASADLNEDDRFLVQLKEDENLPWKDIATRFQTDKGKNFQVAALQMRYKRLREKFRVWEDKDVNALRLAHEYWEKYKWEIITTKMLDFGINERWPPRHCARKWQELETIAATRGTTAGLTPGVSQFSSPVEGPVHFAFMPLQ